MSYRLMTDALMSHSVWSEALHVEISVVLDLDSGQTTKRLKDVADKGQQGQQMQNLLHLCKPVKILVLPKQVKKGI